MNAPPRECAVPVTSPSPLPPRARVSQPPGSRAVPASRLAARTARRSRRVCAAGASVRVVSQRTPASTAPARSCRSGPPQRHVHGSDGSPRHDAGQRERGDGISAAGQWICSQPRCAAASSQPPCAARAAHRRTPVGAGWPRGRASALLTVLMCAPISRAGVGAVWARRCGFAAERCPMPQAPPSGRRSTSSRTRCWACPWSSSTATPTRRCWPAH